MGLTSKLLGYLARYFNRDPKQLAVLSIGYAPGLTWSVADDGWLTVTPADASGDLTAYLPMYTVGTLATFLQGFGYTATVLDVTQADVPALALLQGRGDASLSLTIYTSTLWAWMHAVAIELGKLRESISSLPAQLVIPTAEGVWLDEMGAVYGVTRDPSLGETAAVYGDFYYGRRIIADVIRPRTNNVAIELAVEAYTGQPAKVTDVVKRNAPGPYHTGILKYDGTYAYDALGTPEYGLFNVEASFDLLFDTDLETTKANVGRFIDGLRAAGTHLSEVVLTGSALDDELPAPTDENAYYYVNVRPNAAAPFVSTFVSMAERS
jgi:hypothetical protein